MILNLIVEIFIIMWMNNKNLFTYVETDKVLSYDYDKYIPILNELFDGYDVGWCS